MSQSNSSMVFDSLRKWRNLPLLKGNKPHNWRNASYSALFHASGQDKEFYDYRKTKHNEILIDGVDVKSFDDIFEKLGSKTNIVSRSQKFNPGLSM